MSGFQDKDLLNERKCLHRLYSSVNKVLQEIDNILYCGTMVRDFAEEAFGISLTDDVDGEEVKKVYLKFFNEPPPHLQTISSEMKSKILAVPEVNSISEVVDRFSLIYISFYKLRRSGTDLRLFTKTLNVGGLISLLGDAPTSKDSDEQIRLIFCNYYELVESKSE